MALLAVPGQSSSSKESSLELTAPEPLAFALFTNARGLELEGLIRGSITRKMGDYSGLYLGPVSLAKLEVCAGRLTCILPKMEQKGGRFALLITFLPLSGERENPRGRFLAQLVDQRAAANCKRDVFSQTPERCVDREATVGRVPFAKRSLQEGLSETAEMLRTSLTKKGRWKRYGRVKIEGVRTGTHLTVDGLPKGTIPAGVLLLKNVEPGERNISLSLEGYSPWNRKFNLVAGASLTLQPEFETRGLHLGMLYTGAALAAVGLGFALWAIVDAARLGGQNIGHGQMPAPRFRTFAELANNPTRGSLESRGAVLVAPLGYSLMISGGMWSLGTWLHKGKSWVRWVLLATGAVLGATSYAVSAALN